MEFFAEVFYYVRKSCDAQWKIQSHQINFHDLIFIKSGSVLYKINEREILARQGEALYLPPGSLRSASTSGMECVAFNFRIYPESTPLPLENHFAFDYKALPVLPVIFEEEWFSDGSEYSKIAANGIFMQILSRILNENFGDYVNPHIQKTKEFIARNLSGELNLKIIAGECALSPVYLGALFRRETGMTVKRYINLQRVEAAAKLLIYENYSVGEASARCGYENIFYFSRIFKQIKGVSPLAYKTGVK